MIVRIVKPYQGWRPGETPDIMRSLAEQLIAAGIAVPFNQRTAELKNTIKLSTPPPPAVVVAQPMPAVPAAPAPRRKAARKPKDNANTHL